MKRISEKLMRARILVLAVLLITMFSSVSCGADTHGIRISDGVWSGTVIPDTVPAENVQSEDVTVTEPPDDAGTVTDAVISSDESEPVTMPDTHPDESAPETETAPADTAADDTTAPLPETTAASAGDDESSRDKGSGDDESSGNDRRAVDDLSVIVVRQKDRHRILG